MLHNIRNYRDVIGYLISFFMVFGLIAGPIYILSDNLFGYYITGLGITCLILYISIVKEKLKF